MQRDPVCGMEVDESTGLKLEYGGQAYYFCSGRCMKKFAKEKGIDLEESNACSPGGGTKWYGNRLFIICAVVAVLIGLSYASPLLARFRMHFFMYLKTIWWAIIAGLLLGGMIDHFIPREYISKMLSKPRKSTIFYAVILGFFMSACSHGILALSIELHRKGASVPAVISFLLASPWANLPFTALMLGLFGFKALYIIGCALAIAVITGLVYQLLDKKKMIEENRNIVQVDENFSIMADIRKRAVSHRFTREQLTADIKGIAEGSLALTDMVLWWMILGIALASLIAGYVPSHYFRSYVGPTFTGMLVTLFFATIIEVCSEGSAPLAFELFRQTGALGNSFIFLMAGVVTDYTEIGLIWTNIGRKAAIWLPVVTVPQVMVLGYIANLLFR